MARAQRGWPNDYGQRQGPSGEIADGPGMKDASAALVHDETVLGGFGYAVKLSQGDRVHIVNTLGQQVVDTWALRLPAGACRLSMSHTRLAIGRISPRVGDVLVDDERQPMLRLLEDTSPGGHDTLIAACDAQRYRDLGCAGEHASCAENFTTAVAASGLAASRVPDPLNLFMAVPVTVDGALTLQPSAAQAGSRVVLQALQDLLLVVSACPQDIVPISGTDSPPRSVDIFTDRTLLDADSRVRAPHPR